MIEETTEFPIDDELRGLAEDFLAQSELPAAQVDAAFEGFAAKAAAPASAVGLATSVKLGFALVAALALAAGGSRLMRSDEAPEPRQAALVLPSAELEPASEAAPVLSEAPVAGPELEDDELVLEEAASPDSQDLAPSAPAKSASKKQSRSPKASSASTTKDELLLLERARRALRSGDGKRCLNLLDQHAKNFPRSKFSTERDSTRVAALCADGQNDRAKRAAKRFVAKHPKAGASMRADDPCKR